MRKVVLPIAMAAAILAGGLMATDSGPTYADRGGCSSSSASNGSEKANPKSSHGDEKQSERGCAGTPAPTPSPTPAPGADMKAVSVSVTAPAAAAPGVPFQVSATVSTHNNGPEPSAIVDVMFSLALPADCTATTATTTTVLGRTVPIGVPVSVNKTWNVTCMQAGRHQFPVTGTVMMTVGQSFGDPDPSNNSATGSGVTTVG